MTADSSVYPSTTQHYAHLKRVEPTSNRIRFRPVDPSNYVPSQEKSSVAHIRTGESGKKLQEQKKQAGEEGRLRWIDECNRKKRRATRRERSASDRPRRLAEPGAGSFNTTTTASTGERAREEDPVMSATGPFFERFQDYDQAPGYLSPEDHKFSDQEIPFSDADMASLSALSVYASSATPTPAEEEAAYLPKNRLVSILKKRVSAKAPLVRSASPSSFSSQHHQPHFQQQQLPPQTQQQQLSPGSFEAGIGHSTDMDLPSSHFHVDLSSPKSGHDYQAQAELYRPHQDDMIQPRYYHPQIHPQHYPVAHSPRHSASIYSGSHSFHQPQPQLRHEFSFSPQEGAPSPFFMATSPPPLPPPPPPLPSSVPRYSSTPNLSPHFSAPYPSPYPNRPRLERPLEPSSSSRIPLERATRYDPLPDFYPPPPMSTPFETTSAPQQLIPPDFSTFGHHYHPQPFTK